MKIYTGAAVVLLGAAVLSGCSTTDDKASSSTTTPAASASDFRREVQAMADGVTSPQSGYWTPEQFLAKFCEQYASKPGATQRMVAKDLAVGAAAASKPVLADATQEAKDQESNALAFVSTDSTCRRLPRG